MKVLVVVNGAMTPLPCAPLVIVGQPRAHLGGLRPFRSVVFLLCLCGASWYRTSVAWGHRTIVVVAVAWTGKDRRFKLTCYLILTYLFTTITIYHSEAVLLEAVRLPTLSWKQSTMMHSLRDWCIIDLDIFLSITKNYSASLVVPHQGFHD